MTATLVFREFDPSRDGSEFDSTWDHEDTEHPPILLQAMCAVHRFFEEVRRVPEAFVGRIGEALKKLDRALALIGAKLEELGLRRREIFKAAQHIIAAA